MRYMMAKNRKGIARACAVLVTKILVKRLKTERRIKKRSKCMGSGMHGFGNGYAIVVCTCIQPTLKRTAYFGCLFRAVRQMR